MKYFPSALVDSLAILKTMRRKIDMMTGWIDGTHAPDFHLEMSTGQNVSLRTFQGKYLVLYFWDIDRASSMKDATNIAALAQKYKRNATFLGIDCYNQRSDRLDDIYILGLSWPQALWPDDPRVLLAEYCVFAFPTKVIIDPHGNLVRLFMGTSDDFYSFLEKLLQ